MTFYASGKKQVKGKQRRGIMGKTIKHTEKLHVQRSMDWDLIRKMYGEVWLIVIVIVGVNLNYILLIFLEYVERNMQKLQGEG